MCKRNKYGRFYRVFASCGVSTAVNRSLKSHTES